MNRKAALVVSLSFIPCSAAFGWGPEGHRISVRIAEGYLTPQARAVVAELLGKQSMTDVATWADEVRQTPEYEWSNGLHGARVPDDAAVFKLDRDCAKGCAVSAILKFTRVLEDRNAGRKEKVDALKFLVHFVVDLHQPLHVPSTRPSGKQPDKVEFFAQPTTLHKVWDTLIITHTGKEWPAYAEELRDRITPRQFAKWSACTDPAEWATESHAAAVRYAYDLPEDARIGQAYCDRAIPVINKRLSMAGVRLAARLNAIFRTATTTSAPTKE
jgi:hypothetical protein